ncbi:WD repeat-containing protein 59-like protein [Leptotrombidium deliense]|uniref:WD repeat-containing protein 59-like protein n=1 Tax=Leptotrombidium deliense TaxID=299467 RepID=A0A443S6S1_9ACAR|nr:WD repeat-containing protein 59-like protein [Leptotrombidium deliense]
MTLLREQREVERHEFNTKIIDPKLMLQYDCVKQVYADLLMRWRLHEKRAQILKYVSSANNFQLDLGWKQINFTSICSKCKKDCNGPQCKCHEYSATTFCVSCGHGGHTLHLSQWFSQMDECASGCGCKCLSNEINDCFV